jgi:UDP-N-acetylglucosamine 2-epimerase (non-hydrolysing)
MKIVSLVGARPQFIKEALVGEAVRKTKAWDHILVHSGQHYDSGMSDVFFQELGIPEPKYCLGVGSGTHAEMTAAILVRMEHILREEKPDALLVYGDTNTTLAGALAAAKLHIPVVHVEAGIRMEPKTMPEEINRVLADHVSSVLCCCSNLGEANLAHEGITQGVFVTGDVMYDCFLRMRPRFDSESTCVKYGLKPERFIVATLHRDYNVDKPSTLRACLKGLVRLQSLTGQRVLLPAHPRTRRNIQLFACSDIAYTLHLIEPLGYIEFMSLIDACSFAVTDSGGLQKETYYAGKRCIIIARDTGWRELTDCGWHILCETNEYALATIGLMITNSAVSSKNIYGTGYAADNIVQSILNFLG